MVNDHSRKMALDITPKEDRRDIVRYHVWKRQQRISSHRTLTPDNTISLYVSQKSKHKPRGNCSGDDLLGSSLFSVLIGGHLQVRIVIHHARMSHNGNAGPSQATVDTGCNLLV